MNSLAKSCFYSTLDICTRWQGVRRRIGDETIRFPPRWCRYYPQDYERETFDFIRTYCRPGHTVLDIGAHIGLFSVIMARSVGPTGRVFSFEPTPQTRSVLEATVRLNDCGDVVEIRKEAVTNSSGTMDFYASRVPGCNSNSLVSPDQDWSALRVDTVSIDDLVTARGLHIHCMKIDAEGAELDVLLGAEHTLATCRPVVQLSVHPTALRSSGGSLAELWALLQKHKMLIRFLGDPVDETWFCGNTDLFDVQVKPDQR